MTTDALVVNIQAISDTKKAIADFKLLKATIDKTTSSLHRQNTTVRNLKKSFDALSESTRRATTAVTMFTSKNSKMGGMVAMLGNMNKSLLGMGLNLLFLGMALKQISDTALKGMINTYLEAISFTKGFNLQVNRLAGSWEFLKFSIMDAFVETGLADKLVETLIVIMDTISSMDEETLANIAIAFGVMSAAGAGMMVLGQAMMGLMVPIQMLQEVFTAGAFIKGLGSLAARLSPWIAAIAAIWISDLGGFRDFMWSWASGLWEFIKLPFENVWETMRGVVKIVTGLLTGDLDLMLEGIKIIFMSWGRTITALWTGLWYGALNVLKLVWNLIVDIIANGAKLAISAVQKLIEIYNKIPGVKTIKTKIDGVDVFEEAKRTLDAAKLSARVDYYDVGAKMQESKAAFDNYFSGSTTSTQTNQTVTNNVTVNVPASYSNADAMYLRGLVMTGLDQRTTRGSPDN